MLTQSESLSRYDRFIASRRSKATRTNYRQGIRDMVGIDGEAFLTLAEMDKRRAENLLIDRIIQQRDKWAGSSILSYLAMVKSFLEYEEVHLNWKKIRQVAPKGSFVALDRAPLKESTGRVPRV